MPHRQLSARAARSRPSIVVVGDGLTESGFSFKLNGWGSQLLGAYLRKVRGCLSKGEVVDGNNIRKAQERHRLGSQARNAHQHRPELPSKRPPVGASVGVTPPLLALRAARRRPML